LVLYFIGLIRHVNFFILDVEGGELEKIGIYDNYIIIEVNGKPVNSQKDVEKILNTYKGAVSIKFMDEYGRIYQKGFKMP
jgi:membrane-associated protease RseP (regulator of RpoE activity)